MYTTLFTMAAIILYIDLANKLMLNIEHIWIYTKFVFFAVFEKHSYIARAAHFLYVSINHAW